MDGQRRIAGILSPIFQKVAKDRRPDSAARSSTTFRTRLHSCSAFGKVLSSNPIRSEAKGTKNMTEPKKWTPDPELDLVLERVIDVPPEKVWAAWTEPKHVVNWFTPYPWKTTLCEIDLRPGGKMRADMQGPNGESQSVTGCYLEVIPNRRLTWTDALLPNFRPSPKPFFTGVIEIEPHGTGTKYTATAIHGNVEARKQHEQMGFREGWGKALDQLVEYAKTM
jgi:uncharacterized protein YndB with AHSA1/START domain